ncbi:hypothetical protein, partial [Pusillimonas noertemannii]|uniref:hypothetical protein n=1 Tax=Pusillimonas noertemannii TaxID=305977 RepID=UPI001AD8C413
MDFSNTDGNIEITRDGTDLEFNLNKDIDLGSDGSLTAGNAVVNNDGLTVDDGAGNTTQTTTAGTTVTNTAGASTTVGAGSISVADAGGNETTIGGTQVIVGGGNPITINGGSGTIGGLTNTTFDPDDFTSGQAATEDQLKQVSELASSGWTVTDAAGNDANIGPNGVVTFEGDDNITVTQTGEDQDGVVEITLNENINLGADGSVAIGDTTLDNDGLTIDDGDGNVTTTTAAGTRVTDGTATTTVGAGSVTVTDANGTTTIGSNLISVGGTTNTIVINGDTGTIGGLTNTTWDPDNTPITSGQAAT